MKHLGLGQIARDPTLVIQGVQQRRVLTANLARVKDVAIAAEVRHAECQTRGVRIADVPGRLQGRFLNRLEPQVLDGRR